MSCNPMDLTGRSVLVTGASSGLGRAVARTASHLGAHVLLTGRNQDRLREAMGELEGTGHQCAAFDLDDIDAIPAWMADLTATFAPLSGVVHAAGVTQIKPVQLLSGRDLESVYRVNAVAGAQLLRGVVQRGAADPGGCSVVLIGSVVSCVGAPGLAAYACSKTAILGLVRTAALELARYRIRVNAVLPGDFESPMMEQRRKGLSADQMAEIAKQYPLGIGRSEDVANAVAFLLADAARWITGTGLVVDGGFTAH